jgi:ABC-type spermidine/putrescine transport system permease subunit II
VKRLLTLTALIEVPTGLALVAMPDLVVRLLLGAGIAGAGIPLGRVAGVALLALGVACWFASYDARSCAARGLASAMALYNPGVAIVLGVSAFHSQQAGTTFWPAVILHTVMAVACIASLLSPSPSGTPPTLL